MENAKEDFHQEEDVRKKINLKNESPWEIKQIEQIIKNYKLFYDQRRILPGTWQHRGMYA